MIERSAQAVVARCKELRTYWSPRNEKMKKWYRLIQMVDELKTEKMESFVGNDPRSMYNLVLHLLDSFIPHRLESFDLGNLEVAGINESVSTFLEKVWRINGEKFRKSGPRQSMMRAIIGLLIATGWHSIFAINSDDGSCSIIDVWNPAQVFPMWGSCDMGLAEVAHIYPVSAAVARRMAVSNNWIKKDFTGMKDVTIYDYWWIDTEVVGSPIVCNAIVLGDTSDGLVKFEPTRFSHIPIYIAPVGGLPDTGTLSEGTELSTSSYNAGATAYGERWKEEIGQSIIATNENIYKTWNKWWTFSLQLLRDTAQPAVFERSRSGKVIVKPEDLFRRGAIFRGGPDDSVEFIGSPPIPIELRSTQLDLEAMMQRGGVSWAMYGNVSGQLTAYVMSQIAASANQVIKPFHQDIINLVEDIDNDLIKDIRDRGISPYGWKLPVGFTKDMSITAKYEIEIPGELVQKATVARMLDPDFSLSYTYVIQKMFPDIKNPLQERARRRSDQAESHPLNTLIALVDYYRKQSAFLEKSGDVQNAKLYDLAAKAAEAQFTAQTSPPQQPPPAPAPQNNAGAAIPPELPIR